MHSIRGLVTAALLTVVATTAPGAAQQEQQPPTVPTFRGMIDAVRVDVIVTDGAGRPITDLTRDDFVLTEDGKPQAVESFEVVRIDVNQRPDDAGYVSRIRTLDDEEREARQDDVRLFVIYSASANIGFQDAARVIEPLVEFVESLPPRDMVAVVDNWTLIKTMMLTRDRSEAVRAIRRLTDEDVAQRRLNMLLNRDLLEPPGAEDPILGLEAVSNRLAALRDGRQTIIYLGRGIWSRGNTDIDLSRLINTLNRNNTSVYVLDPAGLTPGVSRMRTDDLRALAEHTGGRAIVNTNQVKEGLDAVAADASFYYLLGYTSSAPADGKFHKIGVTVRRSGAQVRARSGFWSFTTRAIESLVEPPRAPQQVQQALASIAVAASPSRTIRTWIGTHRGETGQPRVVLVWEPAGGNSETPTHVSIVATGSGGEVFKGTSPDPPPDEAATTPRDPVRREVSFDAPPGPLKLQLFVESRTGRLGLETHTIQVPNPSASGAAGISTPRLFVARTIPELRSIQSNPASIPAPRREFVRTERLLVRFDVFRTDAAPRGAFLNRLGEKMFDLVVVQPAAGGAHQIEVPLNSVPQGDYLIEIRVGGDDGARELVPLRIR